MEQANILGVNYNIVRDFAVNFINETHIKDVDDIKKLLVPLGAKISFVPAQKIEETFFVRVNAPQDLEINLPVDIAQDFERFILFQALGHYLLHAKSGDEPCIVKDIVKTDVAKEAIWFALECLLPDKDFLDKDLIKYDSETLARLYRLPSFIVEMKKTIVKRFYNL